MYLEALTATRLYAEKGYPWRLWDEMRREQPIYWHGSDDYAPFWAITRHEDILTVSRHPQVFSNAGRLRIFSRLEDHLIREGMRARAASHGWDPDEPLDMVFMDDPRHRRFRSLTARAFTPGNLSGWYPRMRQLAEGFARDFETSVGRAQDPERGVDLVTEFSAKLPQAIICEMIGLPSEDWPRLLLWTNALVGAADREFLQPGEDMMLAAARAMESIREYFQDWIDRGPRNDETSGFLLDRLLTARVEGAALTEQQIQGYLALLLTAGSETTRNAFTGGVLALLEHPDQLDLLVDEPAHLETAVEEILRWTSPVIQFARTATSDFELSGVRIRTGEDVAMFYPSANRDEAVFEHPYRFDVTRSPNHHLAFGHGSHFCLGANLARLELRAMLAALLSLLPNLEIATEPQRVGHLHVAGIKALHVRRREDEHRAFSRRETKGGNPLGGPG